MGSDQLHWLLLVKTELSRLGEAHSSCVVRVLTWSQLCSVSSSSTGRKRRSRLTLEIDLFLQNAFLLFQLNTFQGQGLMRGQVVLPATSPDHLTVILGTI